MNQFKPLDERIAEKIKIINDCWIWQGACYANNRPMIYYKRKCYFAHRFIYQYVNNCLLDRWQLVCHTCDNIKCVNPVHMFIGTPADNSADMVKKGRQNKGWSWNSKLTPQDVRNIRNNQLSHKEIAKQFNLNLSTVYSIRNRICWKHI